MADLLTARSLTPDSAVLTPDSTVPDPGTATDPERQPTPLELAERRIPPRYRHAQPDHPQVTTWIQQVVLAARPGPSGAPGIATGPSLLIAGPTGVGKTHQAYGAVRGLLHAGVRLRWQMTTAADLYAAHRPRPGHDSERHLRDLARCPLLLIDDLGAAKASEWTEELTYRLINSRYEHLLPTVLTTNLPTRDLRTALGDRVASRLAEMTERVVLTGPDRRRHPSAS
ncbi:ATP-binding protein [Streptomyces sp. B1866]|uniref:ATP-binding protein n=1 Tax=Streptomyces sp. B1866 TaxID=3075431 RepID=UPI0028907854|nr:ATP-binding protein [Streptomyces sp. B1866]MDT3395801.1 ATP-binding protein [Streptomyces sp. B1866]